MNGCPLLFGWAYRKPKLRNSDKNTCVKLEIVDSNYLGNDECTEKKQFICEINGT